jgi:hypothetical protein
MITSVGRFRGGQRAIEVPLAFGPVEAGTGEPPAPAPQLADIYPERPYRPRPGPGDFEGVLIGFCEDSLLEHGLEQGDAGPGAFGQDRSMNPGQLVFVTLDADWARFTEADCNEACQRLRRLGRWYVLRYSAAGPPEWDAPRDPAWTLRQIAEHVSHVTVYAEQVGHLEVCA